jgi:undecaprenyl-diphosphatase
MTDPIRAIILGIVEGLTEFLPVSSTGHMILVEPLLGIRDHDPFWTEAFDIFIQIGAILAVLIYFWPRLYRLALRARPVASKTPSAIQQLKGPVGVMEYASPTSGTPSPWHEHILVKLFVAFLPAAIVGKLAGSWIEVHLKNPPVVAGALIVGGIGIILIERLVRTAKYTDAGTIPLRVALAIGVAQCLAMVPGTSRSAATIMGALVLGLSVPAAAEFSFFLAIPTMFAAGCYALLKHRHAIHHEHLALLGLGFSVAFVVALAVVAVFMRFIQTHRFTSFAIYRILLGIVVITVIWRTAASHG